MTGDYTYENRSNAASVVTVDDTTKTDGINFICGPRCTYASWYMDAGGQAAQSYSMPRNTVFSGWGVSSNLTVGLTDDLKLTSITAFRHADGQSAWDGDNSPVNLANNWSTFDHDQFTQELRLSASIGDTADITVGGYYYDAHSHVGGVRWWNVKHPAAYAQRVLAGESPAAGRETLDAGTRHVERVLLLSRIREGVSTAELGDAGRHEVPALIADGLIDGRAALRGSIVLTLRGRLLADAVVRRLLADEAG